LRQVVEDAWIVNAIENPILTSLFVWLAGFGPLIVSASLDRITPAAKASTRLAKVPQARDAAF
jgi:hypothetical protein